MRATRLRFAVTLRSITVAAAAVAGAFAAASPALADSQKSSNWSGYAAHGNGVRFRQVNGAWRVPTVNCSSGLTTYSAMWVGLGGFATTSNALEQTGTEADCDGRRARYSAWYELVPAPSHVLALSVHPGDLMRAHVTVRGRKVTLTLSDLTRHRSFSRTSTPPVMDITSAEWILEAPGDCSGSRCVTLPLSDFHRAAFSLARVVTTSGRSGGIRGGPWRTTRITLTHTGRASVDGGASPGGLNAAGSAFSLSYTAASKPSLGPSTAAVATDRLVH